MTLFPKQYSPELGISWMPSSPERLLWKRRGYSSRSNW